MTLDEAKAIIDRAWNSSPKLVDWGDVEEASMVIVAETGTVYVPSNDDLVPWPRRQERRAPAPSSRGNGRDYDTAVRRPPYEQVGPLPVEASSRSERPRRRPLVETAFRDLLENDEKPPGYP